MKNKTKTLCGLLLVSTLICQADVGDFEITFKVRNEGGQPMQGVKIGASFIQSKSVVPTTAHDLLNKQTVVVTDTNGEAIIAASSVYDRHVDYGISPVTGYYNTSRGETTFQYIENGKWQPWNPRVEWVLRPIVKPVPMYAKRIDTHIKEPHKKYGYDLMAGDWVAPDGKGKIADLYFEVTGYWKTNDDYNSTLTISFANPLDGVQSFEIVEGSAFQSPREAPAGGYQSEKIELRRIREAGKSPNELVDDNGNKANYFFRVRTVTDESGNIKSALYGKIYGGFKFGGAVTNCYLESDYFLNPEPNSRNMEFDPKQNLLKNLLLLERVSAP